jgi:hypothetical protein
MIERVAIGGKAGMGFRVFCKANMRKLTKSPTIEKRATIIE